MNHRPATEAAARLYLAGETAADLMTPNPISISADATVREAVAFLTDKGFSAAPVIDRTGRPVGVLSRADILVHERQRVAHAPRIPDYFGRSELTLDSGETLPEGFQVEVADRRSTVRDLMTPVVFSVLPDAPASQVVNDLVALHVHRLFVVDRNGTLVGVISALDVMRNLKAE
jgi:CBS domain-containing protein